MAYHSREDDLEPGRATGVIYATMEKDRPVFIPMSSNWFYLGSRDAPLVRQAKPIERPAGIYIGPSNNEIVPARNTSNQSEDHNWRQRKENVSRTEEAIFERNWPHTGTKVNTTHI